MKCLFAPFYCNSPHFETELELMADLLAEGHAVHVLRCTGALAACFANPEHRVSACARCASKVDRGLDAIRHPRLTVEVLDEIAPDPGLQREFGSWEELKAYCWNGVNLGRGACASTGLFTNKDTKLDTRQHAATIWRHLLSAYQAHVGIRRAIERERPDRVYIFNGRFATTYPVVLACQALGIEFYTHDRGASTEHYVLRKNGLPHDYRVIHDEIVATWAAAGPDRERVASAWYEARRNRVELTTVSYTKEQRLGALPPGFEPGARNVAIFNSTAEEYDAIVQDAFLYDDEVVGLGRIVESMQAHPDVRLYLRVHPNLKGIPREENYQLRAYAELERRFPRLHVIWPESEIDSYALMEQATTVLTFGSTMGAEAAFWGKPSVLAGRAAYEQLGCCVLPADHDDLIRLLCSDVEPKGRAPALPYAYWAGTFGTRYRRFRPEGLYGGTYEGQLIAPSLGARARAVALRILGR